MRNLQRQRATAVGRCRVRSTRQEVPSQFIWVGSNFTGADPMGCEYPVGHRAPMSGGPLTGTGSLLRNQSPLPNAFRMKASHSRTLLNNIAHHIHRRRAGFALAFHSAALVLPRRATSSISRERLLLRVKGCRCGYVGSTSGVPRLPTTCRVAQLGASTKVDDKINAHKLYNHLMTHTSPVFCVLVLE
jgi:hypothetical protein